MRIPYCLVEYRIYGTSRLDTFAGLVKNGIYTNTATFPSPPITGAAFDSSRAAFTTAASEYQQYGPIKKTIFLDARKGLVGNLDLLSTYADEVSAGDVSIILMSGFTPNREPQPVLPIEKIETFTAVQSDAPGKVAVEIPPINNRGTVNYNCVVVAGAPLQNAVVVNGQIVMSAGDPQVHQDFNKSRKKIFQTLTPGTQYFFYVFASNSVSVSPLSDPKSLWVS